MPIHSWLDIIGALLLIALIAMILNKQNTANDIHAAGQAFTGAVTTVKA